MSVQKIDIMICTNDRPTEVALLLQSLRTQTYQNFDVYIYDDRSGLPITNHYFIMSIVNRMKLENHKMIIWRNEIRYGVTRLRQIMVERLLKEGKGELILRLDDDNLLEPNYIEKLMEVIEEGYDIAGGLVPPCGFPTFKRDIDYVGPFIADIRLDDKGNIVYFGDECGYKYTEEKIIPSPHFRSMALMKKEVHKKVKYETTLGFCSFHEEEFFSFKAIQEGFKIGIHTGAIAYHLATPSGGERTKEFVDNRKFNQNRLINLVKKIYKEKGDFIEEYRKKFNLKDKKWSSLEFKKETNLLIK